MVQMTQSLIQFLFTHHRDVLVSVSFGHMECFTPEIQKEYIKWCGTDEGKKYLRGGECFKEEDDIVAKFDGGVPE